MLRKIIFGALASVAVKKLYESGAIDRFAEDLKASTKDGAKKLKSLRSKNVLPAPATPATSPAVSVPTGKE